VVVNDLGAAVDGSGATNSAADQVVEEIRKEGGKTVANYDSVATVDGGKNIVSTALNTFGRIGVLVNNAGFLKDKSFNKMSIDEWDAVMGVHLRGAFCVTQPAVAAMREKG
jgi:NAD(P)-dependent dehydrogenase (short-subunit alcohol dehydrogenase family)